MNKVVSINGFEIGTPGDPDEGLIEGLEKLLEEARAGNIAGIAYAIMQADGSTSCEVLGYLKRHRTLGAIEALKFLLME